MPDFDSPIIRATQEDGALSIVPERIASDSVDWSLMAIIVFKILIRVRNTALMD